MYAFVVINLLAFALTSASVLHPSERQVSLTIANLGDSCVNTRTTKCGTGLRCRGGICTQPGLQGDVCSNPGTICAANTICIGSPGSESCKKISNVGETCSDVSMYACRDNLECDGTICTKTVPKGASCWRTGLICETGTSCLGSPGVQTCKALSNIGERCAPENEYICADPLTCNGQICTQTVPDGDPCEGAGLVCNPESTCFGPIGTKACKIVSKLGESCPDLGKYACAHGLNCVDTVCTKTVRKGMQCETPGLLCEAGSTCEGVLGKKTCKVTLGLAQTCSDKLRTMCAEGLECNGSICTQAVIDGEPCEAPGIVCGTGSSCVGPIGAKACKVVSQLGEPCPDLGKYACADSLSCDGTICTKNVLKGGKCSSAGLVCERGSECLGKIGSETCKVTQSVGLTCAQRLKFVCADPLTCNGQICTQTVADGAGCQGPGLVCALGSVCQGTAGSKTCKVLSSVGGSCSDPTTSVCKPGLQCDANGMCTLTVPVGSVCGTVGHVCPSGSQCVRKWGAMRCVRS